MERFDIPQTAAYLRSIDDVYILIHQNPDGDCIGGGYSLYAVLRNMGKRARVLCSDLIPNRYNFVVPDDYVDEEFDPKTIVSVDVADTKLFGSYDEIYGKRVNLCIDHHVSNKEYAERLLLDSDAAAACEVLYSLYRYLGIMTEPIAKALYVGIATDSGCFRFSSTGSQTHICAAEIMRDFPEINFGYINRQLFEVKSPARIRTEMLLLHNMEYYHEGKCVLIALTESMLKENALDPTETDGYANLTLQPEGVEVGVTMREKEPGVFKISLRLAYEVNGSDIAAAFGGRGNV